MRGGPSVFVVQHLHASDDGTEDVKMIGVYESRQAAEGAVARLALRPGFSDCPAVIDPVRDDEESGFYIDEYRIGEDHWAEGFVIVR